MYEEIRTVGEAEVGLFVAEKLFFRTGSYAGLTLQLIRENGLTSAALIGFGGGGGLFNISWGANASFAEQMEDALTALGFAVVTETESQWYD